MLATDTLLADRYRVRGTLGAGGMADVYEALDERLERRVAVKVLRGVNNQRAARRMAGEMSVLAQLNHPSIVRLFDAGEYSGAPFLVMEKIEGPPLGALLEGGPLDHDRIRLVAVEVAEALDHAHRKGIVHRDVKPSNILMDAQGRARLSDFGTAWIASGTRATETGGIVGTPAYVAPEQLQGQQVGPGTDVYALGLVLLECWTGRQEFTGTVIEAAMARLARDPEVPDDLPGDWAALLRTMTARDPQARPSAADVIDHVQGRLPHLAPPPSRAAAETTQTLSPAQREAAGAGQPRPDPASAEQARADRAPSDPARSDRARPTSRGTTTGAGVTPERPRRRGRALLVMLAIGVVLSVALFTAGRDAGQTPSPAQSAAEVTLPGPLDAALDELDEAVRP